VAGGCASGGEAGAVGVARFTTGGPSPCFEVVEQASIIAQIRTRHFMCMACTLRVADRHGEGGGLLRQQQLVAQG
jgi:hypothetical protein